MAPMSFLSELMSSSSSSSGSTTMASGSSTRGAATRRVGMARDLIRDDAHHSETGSEPEKENAKLVSIRELVAKNAAKGRPKLVVMDQSKQLYCTGDSRQNMLNELLSRKMGGGGGANVAASGGRVTASPSSSASSSTSSSSSSTPKTASQRHLQVPNSGGSTALNALNDLLSKRQPVPAETTAAATPTSSKPTQRRRRPENPAVQALLAQRNGAAAAETKKSGAAGESRSRAIAELLAKRVTPHPVPTTAENTQGDARKNPLAEMLAKRGGAKEPSTQATGDTMAKRPTPKEGEGSDPRAAALAEMLAKRSADTSPKVTEPKKNAAVEQMLAKRSHAQQGETQADSDPRSKALAEMLAKRSAHSPQQAAKKSEQEAEPRSKLLADMLANRQPSGDAAPATRPPANPVAAMLAQRQAAAEQQTEPRSQLLADMLSKRQPSGDAAQTASPPANPVAAMLARRQAPAAAENPLADAMAKRQATTAIALEASGSSEKAAAQPDDEHANTPLKDHPKYESFFKMLKLGFPPDVVKHRMQRENVDPAILDCDPSKPLPKEPARGEELDTQDPEFVEALKLYNEKLPKYQRMLTMGLPRGAVEQKMRMEGVDLAWLDGPPQPKKKAAPTGPTEAEIAAHREKYKLYFQMLKMGLPRGAVEHKMMMAGVDPKELDGPFVAGAAASAATNAPRAGLPPAPLVKKANSIRKKIHWEVKRQESRDVARESLWNLPLDEDSAVAPVRISKESKELLEKLFVKEANAKPAAAAKHGADGKKGAKQAKKQVMYLIDMKKSQNIAITLARIKLSFPELKREILALNPTVLSTAQLQSLMDMWPDQQEQVAIDNFHGDESLIGAAEKFLVEVRNIPRFREKLGCLVFKQEFPTRVHELRESINLVIRGVNQVCCSTALQQLFIYILQTGNLLNFGTDDVQPVHVGGFALNSLVKLSQTKAFTGGITFLQYVVQSIERDIPQLARFPQQINLIQKCSKVSISSLFAEKRALDEGLKSLNHEAQAVMPAESDADAELGASILTHFASEVEREIEDLQRQLDQLMDCKRRFLEYFEEEGTSEELDALLSHIANFSLEFEREHTKHLEALDKKRLQEQQRLEQEAKKQQAEKRKQMGMAPRHSMHENPLHHRRSNQYSHGHGHGHKHVHSVKLRHTLGARPEEAEPAGKEQDDASKATADAGPRGQRDYFPQFVVEQLKKTPSFSDQGKSANSGGLGSRTASSSTLESSSTSAA